ncbi:hypothetical protein JOQ06_016729, partial [Pogonophryne albipinna]
GWLRGERGRCGCLWACAVATVMRVERGPHSALWPRHTAEWCVLLHPPHLSLPHPPPTDNAN